MIIDDKGRLFGLINIIDLMVIIFLLSLTPMGYYGWKIYNRPQPQPKTTLEISIKEYDSLQQKSKAYEEEIALRKEIFKKYPRLRKHFNVPVSDASD